jgi:N-glycosylase/DNA lyase
MEWQSLHVEEFDLALTMRSGQFFRYHETDGTFTLRTQGVTLLLRQDGPMLSFTGAPEQFVRELLNLNQSHRRQVRRLESDPVLTPLLNEHKGLRLLRQDLHETILGFLCSSASNIPKIQMNMELFAQKCGKDGNLPLPGTTLDLVTVHSCKTGYRAKYIVETNKRLTPGFLRALKHADYETAHALLCSLPGIGPKIADCICLFALGHGEAFPVDVHLLRAMRTLFPRSRLKTESRARLFAQKRWGKDAGLAQQYLYQYARDKLALRVVV